MKKHSMRILGLLLFLSVAFVQDSFSQDFKPKAEAQSAVQQSFDAIVANQKTIQINDRGVAAFSAKYYMGFLERLQTTTVEDAYNSNHSYFVSIPDMIANYQQNLIDIQGNLLSQIAE